MLTRKFLKRFVYACILLFIAMNIMAYFHAYSFTHFAETRSAKTKSPEALTTWEKAKAVCFGVSNPRPQNQSFPQRDFDTHKIQMDSDTLELWNIPAENSKGTVIMFHGFSGEKSGMLKQAEAFHELGYSTVLVDFFGSGGSSGNITTIGYHEAGQVTAVFNQIINSGTKEKDIVLFGTSMGAVAIMKAMNDDKLKPRALIFEYPFASLVKTVKARFAITGVPSFPMAHLLVFWGGVQHSFNGFSHKPEEYAKSIDVPTLLLWGDQDKKVGRDEVESIHKNLKGKKRFEIFQGVGHENFLDKRGLQWKSLVDAFLE